MRPSAYVASMHYVSRANVYELKRTMFARHRPAPSGSAVLYIHMPHNATFLVLSNLMYRFSLHRFLLQPHFVNLVLM